MSQRTETVTDQSEQQEADGNIVAALYPSRAASQVCIQLKMLSGDTGVVRQEVFASPDDPTPVRQAAEAYMRQSMRLFDSDDRLMTIETCLKDVLRDRAHAMFLRP
jgi:hypothetical protein